MRVLWKVMNQHREAQVWLFWVIIKRQVKASPLSLARVPPNGTQLFDTYSIQRETVSMSYSLTVKCRDLYHYTQGSRWPVETGWSFFQRGPSCSGREWWRCSWTICCYRWSQTASETRACGSVGDQKEMVHSALTHVKMLSNRGIQGDENRNMKKKLH